MIFAFVVIIKVWFPFDLVPFFLVVLAVNCGGISSLLELDVFDAFNFLRLDGGSVSLLSLDRLDICTTESDKVLNFRILQNTSEYFRILKNDFRMTTSQKTTFATR